MLSIKGRVSFTKGKVRNDKRYYCGTIFVGEASGYVNLIHQVSLNAADTIKGKRKFERILRSYGILVLTYRGYNGVYKSKDFLAELEREK